VLSIIVNEKRHKLPVAWEEVDTATYQRIVEAERNELALFCAMIGEEFDSIAEERSEELQAAVIQCTSYLLTEEPTFSSAEVPSKIKLRGKYYEVPKQLELLTIEQNMYIRQSMKTAKYIESLISTAVAVYMQPYVFNGKYNAEEAKLLEKEVATMSIFDTYPIGFFYLSKLRNYGSTGLLYSYLKKGLHSLSVRRWLRSQMFNSSDLIQSCLGLTGMLKLMESSLAKLVYYPLTSSFLC
jgi:hypothetical protein